MQMAKVTASCRSNATSIGSYSATVCLLEMVVCGHLQGNIFLPQNPLYPPIGW